MACELCTNRYVDISHGTALKITYAVATLLCDRMISEGRHVVLLDYSEMTNKDVLDRFTATTISSADLAFLCSSRSLHTNHERAQQTSE